MLSRSKRAIFFRRIFQKSCNNLQIDPPFIVTSSIESICTALYRTYITKSWPFAIFFPRFISMSFFLYDMDQLQQLPYFYTDNFSRYLIVGHLSQRANFKHKNFFPLPSFCFFSFLLIFLLSSNMLHFPLLKLKLKIWNNFLLTGYLLSRTEEDL